MIQEFPALANFWHCPEYRSRGQDLLQAESAGATCLNLLTRDGAVGVEFTPALEPQHYAELFELAQEFESEAALREVVTAAARRWGRQVVFG